MKGKSKKRRLLMVRHSHSPSESILQGHLNPQKKTEMIRRCLRSCHRLGSPCNWLACALSLPG